MRERPPGTTQNGAADAPELELLRLLEAHPEYSQRQMSNALGVSLGKAHYLLGRCSIKVGSRRRNSTAANTSRATCMC